MAEQDPVRLGIIVASTRPGRRADRFAGWIHGHAAQRADLAVELVDLRDYPLPGYIYAEMPTQIEKSHADPVAQKWSALVHALDAYVIVTPEYNHGYPGQLKNAIDHVFTGWWYKPVGFVSYGGFAGGARAVEQLRLVAVELRMVPVRGEVNLSLLGLAPDGEKTEPIYGKRADAMLDQIAWWARAAKRARAAEPPPA